MHALGRGVDGDLEGGDRGGLGRCRLFEERRVGLREKMSLHSSGSF